MTSPQPLPALDAPVQPATPTPAGGLPVNDISATRIIRWIVSVPFTVVTAVGAALWAWPKPGEGGFLWLLSLPVGLGFVYLAHRLTAPPRAPRSVGVPIALAAGLGVLNFGGAILGSMVLPPDSPSDLAMAMMAMTFFWWVFAVPAVLIIAVLKLVDRMVRRSQERSASERDVSGQTVMATPMDTAAPMGAVGSDDEASVSATNGMSAPSPASVTAPAPAPSPAPAPLPGRAALFGVPFLELSTLVEIAASLEEASNPTMMLLTFTADGVEVTAAETELGAVEGRWDGHETVRTLQSARALQEALSGLSPAPTALTLQPPEDDDEDLEISADTGQRIAAEAVRA